MTRLLLALALAAVAIRVLRATAKASRDDGSADDSEIVGMPTFLRIPGPTEARTVIDWEAFFDNAGRLN